MLTSIEERRGDHRRVETGEAGVLRTENNSSVILLMESCVSIT